MSGLVRHTPSATCRRGRPRYRLRIFLGALFLLVVWQGVRIAYMDHGWQLALPMALAGSWVFSVICAPRRGGAP